jgi:hypothetical protein
LVYFFAINYEPQVRLDHFLLGDARFAFGLLDLVDDPAELEEAPFQSLGNVSNLAADAPRRFLPRRRRGSEFFL